MRKPLFMAALLGTVHFSVQAQPLWTLQRDTLRQRLAASAPDSHRVALLIALGQQDEMSRPDSAVAYYRAACELSKRIGYPLGIVGYVSNYVVILNMQGRFEESLALSRQAVAISRENHFLRPLAVSLRNMAEVYAGRGESRQASGCYLEALPYFEQLKDSASLSVVSASLSQCYAALRLHDKAAEYAASAIALANDPWPLANAQLSAGLAAISAGNARDAAAFLQRALALGKSLGDDVLIAKSLAGFATLDLAAGHDATALGRLNEALVHANRIGDKADLPLLLVQRSEIEYRLHAPDAAKKDALAAASLAGEIGARSLLARAWRDLSFCETALGHTEAGLRYDSLARNDTDSLFAKQNTTDFQELNIKYQSEKKEHEIGNLNREKSLQALALRQKSWLNRVLAGSVAALAVIAALLLRNIQYNRKLARQTALLQEQRIRKLETEKQLSASEAILQGQDSERRRVARDLHDSLGGMLSGIKLSLVSVKRRAALPESYALVLSKSIDQLNETIAEMRRIAHNMMPEALFELGLPQAVQDYCASMGKNGAPQIRCIFHGLSERIPANAEVIVYRIVQELVNNAAKHAEATEAIVQLVRSGRALEITVEDNGRGFAASEDQVTRGAGLRNVRSRVDYLRGTLDIRSGAQGTSVHIECQIET